MLPNEPLPPDLAAEWYDAIPRRISSRRYDGTPLAPAFLGRLEKTCDRLTGLAERARAVLVGEAPPEVFTGLVGSYGRIGGAPALTALVGPKDAGLEVGYIGEAVILDATAAGIDSVWLAGAFDAGIAGRLADLGEGERVHAIIALGRATKTISVGERLMRIGVRARHRLPLDTIAPGHADWPAWAREAAEAVRLAPSGGNTQPWRLSMDDGHLVVTRGPRTYRTATIDFGIAMLHAELGALHAGVRGSWAVGGDAEVARFVPEPQS